MTRHGDSERVGDEGVHHKKVPLPHALGSQKGMTTPEKPQGWPVGNVAKSFSDPG